MSPFFKVLGCGAVFAVAFAAFTTPATAAEDEVKPLVEALRAVGPKAEGHQAATKAWAALAKLDASHLPTILEGMDGAGPLATNWLRGAVDAIAQRELKQGGELPIAELKEFLSDTSHSPRARRTAFEWIVKVEPRAETKLIEGMIDDPSLELRRDAVGQQLSRGKLFLSKGQEEASLTAYKKAFEFSRDFDQIKDAQAALAKAGVEVDVTKHLGFIQNWQLIAPFDNTDGKGFDVAYPPEKTVDFSGSYPGKKDEVRWTKHTGEDEYGLINLNEMLDKHKGAICYAATEFFADSERDIEIRIGCINGNKVWLNGELLITNEVYHSNEVIDQYIGKGKLKPGRNVILVKVCQNEQEESWAQRWEFQLRVCDETGKGVLSNE